MWNSTEAMVKQMAETLASEGVEIVLYNLAIADIGDLAKDLVDSRAIIIGAPTVLGEAHPLAVYAAHLLKLLRPPVRYAVFLSSYGWGGGAVRQIQSMLDDLGIEVVGTLEINGPPTEEHIRQVVQLGKALAQRIREWVPTCSLPNKRKGSGDG
jgi:flavorubredoxin